MNKRGFTLVELVAAIILLGSIIGVTMVGYNKYVENSEKDGFESSLNGILRSIDLYVAENIDLNYNNETSIDVIDGEYVDLFTGSFKIENNRVTLINITDGYYCGNGYKNNFTVEEGSC